MKSLRRSFNKDPPPISTPISTFPALSKPLAFQQPPKKVIRCIQPYRSQSPRELSSTVGDFLYVAREIDTHDGGWYEVTNPANSSRGIVPKYCFEEILKNGPTSISAGPNARLPPSFNRSSTSAPGATRNPPSKHQTFYAIVQYDFSAERPDELDARAGEPISVVAQSNREWFVAKPIGRLGGPGLIPVSFVEIRDPLTNLPVKDVDGLMDRGVLPRVEEWKQATAEYKASSIPLGVIDDIAVGEGVKDSPFMKQAQWNAPQPAPTQQYNADSRPPQHGRNDSQATTQSRAVSHAEPEPQPPVPAANSDLLPPGTILSATIPSFHYENNEYWFRIDAMYRTEDPSRTLQLVLYRNYDDFYQFQIALLDAFPVEAGRKPASDHSSDNGYPTPPASVEESTRILPYMPGPVSFVDDMITSVRRTELDQYLGELCELEHRGAGHVLKHELVLSFISPKSGDVVDEVEAPPLVANAWSKGPSGPAAERILEEDDEEDYPPRERNPWAQHDYADGDDDVASNMERMRLKQPSSQQQSRTSGVSYDGYGAPAPTTSSRSGHTNEYDRSSNGGRCSGTDYGRTTPAGTRSRGSSPQKNAPRTRVEQADSRPSSLAGGNGYQNSSTASTTPYSGAGPSGYPSDPNSNYPSAGHAHSYSYSSATGSSTLSPPLNQGQHPYSQGGPAAAAGSRSARSSSGNTNPDHSPNPSSSRGADHSDSNLPPAFLKIKIFHSESDDLIAIRVPPKVTYSQLINKVRDRLGSSVSVLRYRDSFDGSAGGGGGQGKNWKEIVGDAELREWISKGDKLVLYAD